MRLVRRGDSWAIEGEGSSRAQIAYATAENGHLRFTVQPAVGAIAR
jgi:hypothetical protein